MAGCVILRDIRHGQQITWRIYTELSADQGSVREKAAACFGQISFRDMRLDQRPLSTFPEWLGAYCKQGRVNGVSKTA